jgi:hypothetical protein
MAKSTAKNNMDKGDEGDLPLDWTRMQISSKNPWI